MSYLGVAYDLNLAEVTDEALVVLAEECEFQAAETELLLRYRPWSQQMIMRLSRRRGLTLHEAEDAAQEAVFSLLKAIQRYNTDQMGRIKGCSFQSFAGRVITDGFKDFVKRLWRIKSRFGRSLHFSASANSPNDENSDVCWVCTDQSKNPVHMSQRREMDSRLQKFIDALDAPVRIFLIELLAGARLRAAATTAGLSYDQGKRMRRRLRSQLANRLGVSFS